MQNGVIVRVKWLRTANSNLNAAATYIAKENTQVAQEMYAHIRGRVAELAKFPDSGRPGRVFGTRELVIERYSYIVPYRIRGNEVQIIRVFHTSQKLPEGW